MNQTNKFNHTICLYIECLFDASLIFPTEMCSCIFYFSSVMKSQNFLVGNVHFRLLPCSFFRTLSREPTISSYSRNTQLFSQQSTNWKWRVCTLRNLSLSLSCRCSAGNQKIEFHFTSIKIIYLIATNDQNFKSSHLSPLNFIIFQLSSFLIMSN